ncbi:MAG: DNA topoisomerase 4 subunit A [Anaerolineae bacterium]|nr:DNA topoisomerase 4 subunit A [Anaerolineae bacterium]
MAATATGVIERPIAEPITDTIELHRDMTDAYIGYARETITDRALPDVRDGLKPVQRRILYAMHDLGLLHNRPHKKSARIVGEVLGKYHPHGDSSVYLAMVRMAQDFVMEVPLVDGQGNYGSIDGDSPAAMRYTEARLTELAEMMLQDLQMDTVAWQDNFDGSLQEPTVLPSVLPNLLVNGVDGIAVGMATKIPPHNLGEVCDAVVHVAKNWKRRQKITVDELMEIIPGPDFPTGGLIYRYRENGGDEPEDVIRQAYATGRGRIVMQARIKLEDIGGGKTNIIIDELPYAVLKTTVIEKLAREVRDGRLSGVTDLRDESDYTGMRVVIELSRNASPDDVLTEAMKYSQLRETFGVINLALVPQEDGTTRPMEMPLVDLLTYFVQHRLTVIERRSRYELEQRRARLHIVEGLLKALDILDEVIDTIRRSRTSETAHSNLMRKFGFSDPQATAILNMQLRRLAALERRRLVDEQKELQVRIAYLESLVGSEAKRLGVVIEETTALKKAHAQPRRTVIIDAEENAAGRGTFTTQADLVMPEGRQLVILTPNGLQRRDATGYYYRVDEGLTSRAPAGGGHLAHLEVEPTQEVLLFSSKGRGWKGAVGFIPEEAGPEALGLEKGEEIVGMAIPAPGGILVMVSQSGKVKRTKVEDLSLLDRTWDTVMGLADESDRLLTGTLAGDDAHIVFYTREGQVLRIEATSVNPQQTGSASGVAGINVRKNDQLLGAAIIPNGADEKTWQLVVVSENGYAHRFSLVEISVKGRATMGVRALRSTKSSGKLADLTFGKADDAVDIYLRDGRRQHIPFAQIPETSRDVTGDQLVKDPKKEPVVEAVVLR